MKKIIFHFAFVISFIVFILSLHIKFAGENGIENDPLKNVKDASLFSIDDEPWVESILNSMTIEEKIGQMIFPYVYGKYYADDSNEMQRLETLIKGFYVGGFIFFQSNLYDQVILTNKLQALSKVPLLISSDYERGAGMRTSNTTSFPYNMALGAVNDEHLVYLMGKVIARESRALGVNLNFAPVSDVNSSADNPVINVRSFGDNPLEVAKLSSALIKGMQEGRLISTSKHFPGHGSTSTDSHSDLAFIQNEEKRFYETDLFPFIDNIKNGVLSVMTGHLSLPRLTNNKNIPASLSYSITSELLQKRLSFNGLVITDALNMQAITKYYSSGEAAVMAIEAGNDVLLFPENEEEAFYAIRDAVTIGRLSEERINKSVRKILLAKRWVGLNYNREVDINDIPDNVNINEHVELANKLAEKSITLLIDKKKLIPVFPDKKKKYVHIILLNNRKNNSAEYFNDLLKSKFNESDSLENIVLNIKASRYEYASARDLAAKADFIFLSVYANPGATPITSKYYKSHSDFIEQITSTEKPLIFLSHGSPYSIANYKNVKTYITNYGDADVSENALVKAIFGEIPITGKLPVYVPKTTYQRGNGLILGQSILNLNQSASKIGEKKFSNTISMINEAIKDSVFPGAQMLVVKDGKIEINKCFGKLMYDINSADVNENTLYDLASLTKVIATTTAAMICYDKKLFQLDDPVMKYLPKFGVNGKEKITIKNLLLHNSGLPAFILYYKKYDKPEQVINDIFNLSLEYPIGTKTVYSDLGFIVLQKVIEKVTKKKLDVFCRDEIFKPLEMNNTMFNPPKSLRNNIAPTELDDYWRKRLLIGEVHDENSFLLGGVAGHAGLFSNASDLAILLQMLLQDGSYKGKQLIKKETIKLFTSNIHSSSRALGWDLKSEQSSSGKYFSASSYGHTGFTGTSVWIDPEKKIFVIFLTNRVYPTRENRKLIPFRSKLHDSIMKELNANK